MSETISLGPLSAYPRPPQTNGAEHYDVEMLNPGGIDFTAGRLTRRNPDGWYAFCCYPRTSYVLRTAEAVRYHPTPEAALDALFRAIFPSGTAPDVPPCPCECNRTPKEFCGGCGHAGCGRR